ncbi:MAG: hypothetical protein EXS64_20690 [Candidatus Latescibacteria bacterium]|nr:hypothetical protein [Candidatus Latescibacterota bacterium]
MKDQLDKVEQFHEAFKAYIGRRPTAKIPERVFDGRLKLLQEELEEYRRAVEAGDLVEVADALTDMLYVLLGTYLAHGLQGLAVDLFDEVHRSNMRKLDENGQPILSEAGKVEKSALFSKPDLGPILARCKP